MEQDKEKTKVIFRVFMDEVVAIFPELVGSPDPRFCSSYAHVGQHGDCDPDLIIADSRPASPEEYEYLKKELETHYGYNFQVIKRNRYSFYETRRKELRNV